MTRFTNDPPANCGGYGLRLPIECQSCDRLNPFGGVFEPDVNVDSGGPRCISRSNRHPRPDYQEVAL